MISSPKRATRCTLHLGLSIRVRAALSCQTLPASSHTRTAALKLTGRWCPNKSITRYGVFFLMIRRPPRSTRVRSSAASDVYKRQVILDLVKHRIGEPDCTGGFLCPVSYTHLRAHETPEHLVCRLLLEKKKKKQ